MFSSKFQFVIKALHIRVIFYLIMTFDRELVVLLTELSMFARFLVHVWRCFRFHNTMNTYHY